MSGPKPVDHHIAPPIWPRPSSSLPTLSNNNNDKDKDEDKNNDNNKIMQKDKEEEEKTNSISLEKEKKKYLVIDTNAFIKGVRLDQLATEFFTVPEVVKEVKDNFAKRNLEQVHFDIKTRDPSNESLIAVSNFAKKKGDFSKLSETDLRVLALTWMLEKEVGVGVEKLKTEPVKGIVSVPPPNSSIFQVKTVSLDSSQKSTENNQIDVQKDGQIEESNEATNEEGKSTCDHPHVESETSETSESAAASTEKKKKKKKKKQPLVVVAPVSQEEDDEEDNDDDWITPDNIEAVKKQHQGDVANEFRAVGCITSDFAMQNVILQMGMGLLTIDGMVIKKVTTWVQKCFSCYNLCMNNEKRFCPSCGNSTLYRVSIEVTEDGEVLVHERQRRNIIRGTQYAVGLPKGGRNNKDLIFDEYAYEKALVSHTRQGKKSNVSDLIGSLKMKNDDVVIGYGRKNPNVHRAKVGKKNRNPSHRV